MANHDVTDRLVGIEATLVAMRAGMTTKTDLAAVARNVEITALARLVEQQRDDVASIKDDISVLTAIVQRLDNSHTRLLTEIRATHAQVSRLADRVGRVETRKVARRPGRLLI